MIQSFISYSHQDLRLARELAIHLAPVARLVDLDLWWDQEIGAGSPWNIAIDTALDSSDIVLALVSPDFLASQYCAAELRRARQIHRDQPGALRIVPVLLRPCSWQDSEISDLQLIPSGARPVTGFRDRDSAWAEAASAIRDVARTIELYHDGAISLRAQLPGREFSIRLPQAASTSIGRSGEARIRLPVESLSRQHCEVFAVGGQMFVRDLGSKNGTFLDGHRISDAPLRAGSCLRLGRLELAVEECRQGLPETINDPSTLTDDGL